MTIRTILLFGGLSRERLVSVASAQTLATIVDQPELWFWRRDGRVLQVHRKALALHSDVFVEEFDPEGRLLGETLPEALDANDLTDAVFVIGLHGGAGENGTIAEWMEQRTIAFTGSGSKASRLAFDKPAAKDAVSAHGVRVARSIVWTRDDGDSDEIRALLKEAGRLVLKPAQEGSSYGMRIVDSPRELDEFLSASREDEYDAWLIEEFVDGVELTGGVIESGGQLITLPTVEIRAEKGRVFDYQGKYLGSGIREICPAEVPETVEQASRDFAKKAHEVLECYGYSRSDFIVGAEGPVYLETNTLPGLTKSSLLPQELRAARIGFRDFIDEQIRLARLRYD